jgi:hypothetical protein
LLKYFGVDVGDEEFGAGFDPVLVSAGVVGVVGFGFVGTGVAAFFVGATRATGVAGVAVRAALLGVAIAARL